MRKELSSGTKLKLVPIHDKTTARVITVKRLLGQGAGSIAYLVEEDGISFVMKECFPFAAAERDYENSLIWRSSEIEEKAKARFETAFDVQIRLMMDLDSMNQTARLAGALFTANNTLYTLTDRRNATTYDRVKETSLTNVFVTARAIAGIVGAYHKAGYLHLDIKPENIMVYPETREMVQMIDFDSIIPMSDKDALTLSFSPRYAAPELVALDVANICEATDYYEIGATAFVKVFGRFPESRDRSIFSRWGFSALFEGKSEKLKRMSTVFFNKTLAANPGDRFHSMDELVECLDALIKESQNKIHLVSSLPESHNIFVGRERELQEITEAFSRNKTVVLNGIGGIGKTELALAYASRNKENYDVICFGRVTDSMERLFDSSTFLNIAGENRSDRKGIQKIADLVDDRTLLVIDNLDSIDDPMIDDLYRLDCRILITSRCDLCEQYTSICQLEIEELETYSQEQLFFMKAQGSVIEEDRDSVRRILRAINGYTLLIPLIADLCRRSPYSIRELARMITKSGLSAIPPDRVRAYKDLPLSDSVNNILYTVLDVTGFSAGEKQVMGSLSLLSCFYVERVQLLDWMGREYNDTINELADRGWLSIRGSGKQAVITLHPIIEKLYKAYARPSLNEFRWIGEFSRRFVDEFYVRRVQEVNDRQFRLFELICGIISESCLESEEQAAYAIDVLLDITGFYQLEQYHVSLHPALDHIKSCSESFQLANHQWKLSYLNFISSFDIKFGQKCIRAIGDKSLDQDDYALCLFNIFRECLSTGSMGIELFVKPDLSVDLPAVQEFLVFFHAVADSVMDVLNAEPALKAKIPEYKEAIDRVDRQLSTERYSHGEKFEYDPFADSPEYYDDNMEEFYRQEDEKVYQALSPEKQLIVDDTRTYFAYLDEFHTRCHSCLSPEEVEQLKIWLQQEKTRLIEIQEFVVQNPKMVRMDGGETLSLDLASLLYFVLCVDSCFQHDTESAVRYYNLHLKTESFGMYSGCYLSKKEGDNLSFLLNITDNNTFRLIINPVLKYIAQLPDEKIFQTPLKKAELSLMLAKMIGDAELMAYYEEKCRQARIEKDRMFGIRFQRKE